jgi:hypothetical protein
LYSAAIAILNDFRHETDAQVTAASKELFTQRLAAAERTKSLPDSDDQLRVTELVLPKIIEDSSDIGVMSKITEWITAKYRS